MGISERSVTPPMTQASRNIINRSGGLHDTQQVKAHLLSAPGRLPVTATRVFTIQRRRPAALH